MSAPLRRGPALVRQRLLGLVFLGAVGAAVWTTTALYQQKFTPVTMVTLEAGRAGNQLTKGADVKIRGLLVGTVREVESTGDGARLQLAIDDDRAGTVPADVTGRLIPKTLFGEKYVALVPGPGAGPVQEGAVIRQDRSATAIETERVFDDLLPLLESLRPDDLSNALGALSGTLRGRGEQIGANLEKTGAYLAQINPALPDLQRDLVGVADLADTYDDAAPDFLALLDDLSFSSRSLVDQRDELSTFLQTSTGFAGSADSLLRDNRDRLIGLAADSLPSLQVYARYSPSFPCLSKAFDEQRELVADTFGGLQPGLHITLETTRDNGGFVDGDQPQNGDDGGPSCRGLPPNQKEIPFPVYRNGIDGYCDPGVVDPATGTCTSGRPEAAVAAQSTGEPVLLDDPAWSSSIVGASLGKPAAEVSGLSELLFAPLARGTTVTLD